MTEKSLHRDDARFILTSRQRWVLIAVLAVCAGALAFSPAEFARWLTILLSVFYLSTILYKFGLVFFSLCYTSEINIRQEALDAMDERLLPGYTILVPLYRETGILSQTISAISQIDYPRSKLDVKLLIEESDGAMREALAGMSLPGFMEILTVPDVPPRTKPKACDYGLDRARGEFLVIYDAEDIPDADQLKKSVAAFRSVSDPGVVCLQAKLNYYNPRQNLLTRWFTAEYSMWFDLYLPGLDFLKVPIPLGGTSNHFRTEALRKVGGWDPYNVAEDCDLGIRLFREGYRTRVLDSTTWEEANSRTYNWMRQRSRWVKGYLQTYLVHMRHPALLIRQIGYADFLSFQITVGGHILTLLLNPIYWIITLFWLITNAELPQAMVHASGFGSVVALILLFSNFIFVFLNVLGCVRRKYPDLVKETLISPLYWVLMSAGAWKGFLQLFTRPHYWEKTNHGLFTETVKSE